MGDSDLHNQKNKKNIDEPSSIWIGIAIGIAVFTTGLAVLSIIIHIVKIFLL
jgi:hypothetical protein